MAKKNPGGFGKLANHRQERWKVPLPEFIANLYFKHFGKKQPDTIKSIEQIVKEKQAKRASKKADVEKK